MKPVATATVLSLALATLAACQTAASSGEAAVPHVERPVAGNVLAFAQAACGDCHGVEHNTVSANPLAPEWPRIVNDPNLTRETLRTWLTDAHNYPEDMDFTLNAPQIEELVTYMLSLRQGDYERPTF